MTSQTKAILKSYFNTGDFPTEAQFSDIFDSFPPVVANVVVAAVDAPQRVIDYADYVCDGINDEVQIQAAIDALPATGGQVSLSSGNFVTAWAGEINADTLITPYCVLVNAATPPLSLVGIPGATNIKIADGQPKNTGILSIRGTGAAPRTNPTFLSGLWLDGNATNQPAWDNLADLLMVYAKEITIGNCRFKNWKRNGVHAFRIAQKVNLSNNYFLGQGALRLENHYYSVIGNTFEDNVEATGVSNVQLVPDYDVLYTQRISSFFGNIFIGGSIQLEMNATQSCTIMGNSFADQSDPNWPCISVTGNEAGALDAKNNIIVGNSFYNIANGIWLMGGATRGALNNIVAHNNILDGPDRNIGFGIYELGVSANNNTIIDNYIDATAATKISTVGANTVVRGNKNYTTENDGAASTADGGTIAHGCAATPTVATVSGSVAGEIVTVTAISSTTITVAIKDNDGSAGTTQTVYWRAEV